MRKLLVATTNRGKVREIVSLLEGLPFELITLGDGPRVEPPEETGRTFAENARIKSIYYASATGLLTVAEDSGLEIEAMGGAPGVESARFGGTDTPYAHKFGLIYDAFRRIGTEAAGASARFVCALALAKGGDVLFEARGAVEGEIAPSPRGDGGFGYDPIFFYPPFRCTLAEAGARKSTVSHRGEAFGALRAFLTDRGADI